MNASYEWLRELVPTDASPAEMADLLTARCAAVDEIARVRPELASIVVARVVNASRHPNADRLWVTKVDAGGDGLLDVVCGAPNVKEGALYPFAHTGVLLPDGRKLERAKIRGQSSNGMLCSARELGLGEDHTGILELDVDAPPGTPLPEVMPVSDSRIVVDVTPNRPDLLSHVGLARELAAATGVAMRRPSGVATAAAGGMQAIRSASEGRCDGVGVRLEDVEGCPRYVGLVLRNVRVGPSPNWLRLRLEAIGQRTVNNVVDVTNYLLHECGQPMHAFDLERLGGASVIIRRARRGEELETLDGVVRQLSTNMTVIADAQRAHAVAGVMGGAESAVSEGTHDIFLEIANFEAARVRATRIALALSTDASYRFERGVDPELPGESWKRAVELLGDVAGGELAAAPLDLYPEPRERATVALRVARVEQVLGTQVTADEIINCLQPVGFTTSVMRPGGATPVLEVSIPSWRVDVSSEIDLVEEVARLRGFDSFPDEIRPYRPGNAPDDPTYSLARKLRTMLAGLGLLEARPIPFTRGDDATHVRLANPIADDERHLRRSILESLAARSEYNLARMQRNVRLFEIGRVFFPDRGELPIEETHVGAVVMGDREPVHFTQPRPAAYDAWDAKALAELLMDTVFPESARELVPASGSGGDMWVILVDGERRGRVTRLALDAPVWAAPAFGIELSIDKVPSSRIAPAGSNIHGSRTEIDSKRAAGAGRRSTARRYRHVPEFPSVDFDLALIVPDSVPAARVAELLRALGGELLEDLLLFDEFRGAGIPVGTRSLAWRLTFRHPKRTLRDKEVEVRRQKILTALEKELGVRQRST